MNLASVCGVKLVILITSEESKNALVQTNRRGRRLSIIGLLQPVVSFVYGLVIGGVNRKSYIHMMEQEAIEAQRVGRIRVIVQMGRLDTSMLICSTVMVKMGKYGFIHIFLT